MKEIPNRKGVEIKIWMLRKRIKQQDVERATGVDQSSVSRTINGKRNCRPVLEFFLENGCPRKYLGLPKDLQMVA
jgi:transcriptional regulator with XRE-family HTH domain